MSESVGAKLKQARELRRLTVEQVAEATKIRSHYLQALENDDHSAIPSAAQARGFLRIYADFLELNLADLMPVVQPSESLPTPQSTTASGAVPPAAETSLPDNILTRLRARFTRQSGHRAASNQPEEAAHPVQTVPTSPAENTASEPTEISSSGTNPPKTVKKKRNVSG